MRPINVIDIIQNGLSDPLLMFREPIQIGPGRVTALSLASHVSKTRRADADRASKGRWHSGKTGTAKGAPDLTIAPNYMTPEAAVRAYRRMQRAIRRHQRFGGDLNVPRHITDNGQRARAQLNAIAKQS